MPKQRMTPLERLNDPGAILNLFIGLLIASFVGAVLGTWLKAATSDEPFMAIFATHMPFVWVPTALALAIVGAVLFRRAERKAADARSEPTPDDERAA